MTRRPSEIDPLGDLNLPEIPEAFIPSGFADRSGVWKLGLGEVHADDADNSGPMKAYRRLLPLAWAVALAGRSTASWREYHGHAQQRKFEALNRIAALERQGRDASAERSAIAGAEKDISKWDALLKAAAPWPGVPELRALPDAAGDPGELAEEIARLRRAGISSLRPEIARLEGELIAARKVTSIRARAEAEARARFDRLNEQMQKATAAAFNALAGTLRTVETRLAKTAREIVHGEGVGFLLDFPTSAPDTLLPIIGRALRVSDLIGQLSGDPHEGFAKFLGECGEDVAAVVRAKAELQPLGGYRETGPAPLESGIMGAIF